MAQLSHPKSTGVLFQIADYCEHKVAKPDLKFALEVLGKHPTEEQLREWIVDTGKKLTEMIPDEFWTDNQMKSPGAVTELAPSEAHLSTDVLLCILWSWCSRSCSKGIVDCMRSAAQKLTNYQQSNDSVEQHRLRLIDAFSLCVKAHVWYSRTKLSEECNSNPKDTFLRDAQCLGQAVASSSKFFSFLTAEQLSGLSCFFPKTLVGSFLEYLNRDKKKSNNNTVFSDKGEGSPLQVFFDGGDKNVIKFVSISEWFMRMYLKPRLRSIMKPLMPVHQIALDYFLYQGVANKAENKHESTWEEKATEEYVKLRFKLSGTPESAPLKVLAFTMLICKTFFHKKSQAPSSGVKMNELEEEISRRLLNDVPGFLGLENPDKDPAILARAIEAFSLDTVLVDQIVKNGGPPDDLSVFVRKLEYIKADKENLAEDHRQEIKTALAVNTNEVRTTRGQGKKRAAAESTPKKKSAPGATRRRQSQIPKADQSPKAAPKRKAKKTAPKRNVKKTKMKDEIKEEDKIYI